MYNEQKEHYYEIFFQRNINGAVYRDIVTQFVMLLECEERNCILQQDSVWLHILDETKKFLQEFFGDRLVSTGLRPRSVPFKFFLVEISWERCILDKRSKSRHVLSKHYRRNIQNNTSPTRACVPKSATVCANMQKCFKDSISSSFITYINLKEIVFYKKIQYLVAFLPCFVYFSVFWLRFKWHILYWYI